MEIIRDISLRRYHRAQGRSKVDGEMPAIEDFDHLVSCRALKENQLQLGVRHSDEFHRIKTESQISLVEEFRRIIEV